MQKDIHLLFLFFGLALPKEIQTSRPLELASVQNDSQKEELERAHGTQEYQGTGSVVVAVEDRQVGQVEE